MNFAVKTSVVLAAVAHAAIAQGHFLWVDYAKTTDGTPEARFYFSEAVSPGSAELLDRIEPTKAWVRQSNQKDLSLELTATTDAEEETGALTSPLPSATSLAVEAECQYGVFTKGEKPALLKYYAKHLRADSPASLSSTAQGKHLALDIVPRLVGEKVACDVRWKGKPLGQLTVFAIDAEGDEQRLTTNDEGRVTLDKSANGQYAVRVMYVDSKDSGELDGTRYEQALHVATLTLCRGGDNETAAPASDRTATQLLSDARAARAVWNDFPGFRASLTLKEDGKVSKGTITVSADGEVELKGIDADGFVQQQLDSLVMHRMPTSTVEDEGANFEPDSVTHVLGRSVRLEEERMGSVYRIQDNVIREVNRKMGDQRFTITVLDVKRNHENLYLPHVYTVDFWSVKDGALRTSITYHNEWVRLNDLDLPSHAFIVSSDGKGRRVISMDFSDHELLKN
jgi:hypothetical protein